MLRAIVPLVGARRALVLELVFNLLPRLAAIVRALDLLAKPAARLRCIEPVGRDRRALEMIHLPTREERAGDFPLLACAIRGKNECALAGAHENSDAAH